MKVDISFSKGGEAATIKFFLSEFLGPKDTLTGLSILTLVAADFDLDPELEPEEFDNILTQIKEEKSEEFTVSIDEEGIEIDLD